MNTPSRTARRAARALVALALCAAAIPVAWATYTALQPAAPLPATTLAVTSTVAAPFRDIRPADLDGTPPPIPPAELWPAQ